MKIVTANILKSRMAELFREIEATGEEVLVTHNGEIVMKIISYHRELGGIESRANEQGSSS